MSYARMSTADVYVFATGELTNLKWTCCMCGVLENDPYFATRSEMIAHLKLHEVHGHSTGTAIDDLESELADHGETEFRAGDGIS